MKQISLITICLTLVLFSCGKKETKKMQYHLLGYIFNSSDSTPFANTKFKVYNHAYANGVSKEKVEEFFFTTDNLGHFDVTTEITGLLTWPSYSYGAVYTGPPHLGMPKRDETDNVNRINTTYFDTLYTTLYH
jgi:hypothetical protein